MQITACVGVLCELSKLYNYKSLASRSGKKRETVASLVPGGGVGSLAGRP